MKNNFYTPEQLCFVQENRRLPCGDLAELFNKKFNTNKTKGALSGLRKRKKWKTGNDCRFKKGHISANKGKGIKGVTNTGSFKKGLIPHNHVPIGTERFTSKDAFIKVKIAYPNKWVFKHRLIWEAVHGLVPKNHCLIFIDTNRNNCTLENIELITRAEMLRMNKNKYKTAPKELKPAIKALSKLEVKMFEKQKCFT